MTANQYDSLGHAYGDERQQGYTPYPYGYMLSQPYYTTAYPYYQPYQQPVQPYQQPDQLYQQPVQPYQQPDQQAGFGLQTPTFAMPMQAPTTVSQPIPGMLPLEESYIENILRLNKGKVATIYATFENNREWNAKIFRGVIEAAGRDHVILSDPQTGMRYLLPMIYVDYITFDEEIAYEYPYAGEGPELSTYAPR
jgi:spore germination protein Q